MDKEVHKMLKKIFDHWSSIPTHLGDHEEDCEYFISAVRTAKEHRISGVDVSNYFSEHFSDVVSDSQVRFQGMISAVYHYEDAQPWNLGS
jgi:hypothetical protein